MSEDIDKLNASARELTEVIRSLTGQIGDLTGAAGANVKTTANMSDAERKAAEALAKLRVNTDGLSEVEKARIEAQKKLLEYDRQLAEAGAKAKDALKGFASGILETNVKLTNLNQGLSAAGDAAFALGKAFGPLGMVIGGLVKGFTMLMEANLKISQAYLEGKDQISKMGGAGTHTTKSLQSMAREADLNAETLGRMIKPMQSMGQSIMSLGGNAGDAQKSFAKLIKATDDERAMMSRLGINQEQMMQGTADYLALQSASGRGLQSDLRDREKLRKESIAYQVNLQELAALTGKDVDALKAEQKEMLMNRQVQLKNMMDNAKEDRLRREAEKETDAGRKKQLLEQADAIAKESKARNDAFAALAGGPKILQKGIQELTTGTINGENAQKLARLGMQKEIDEFNKTIREGGDQQEAARKLQDAYIQKFGERVETTGRQMAISGEVAKMYGADSEQELELISNRRNKSYAEEGKIVDARIKAAQQAGTDPAADARAKLENANIKAAGAMEDLITYFNPFKLGLIGLTAAAGAAALALGVMAKRGMFAGGDGGGMMDKIKGMFGAGGGGGGGAAATGGAAAAVPGGAGAGQIAEGLGKGPAGGGKGFLERAADGLAAFANPKVVVGAGAFGVAIAAVGAGIAGATWIVSKALPSLAEGLTPFEKLDGDKLKKSGAGIAAIGGGLAAFGAGGALGALGGIVGGLGDKLGKAMGMDGPFKKLEDFSKLNIDADKVKANAEAFMAFNKAMAVGGAAGVAGAAGGLFGGLMDKLSSKLDLKGPLVKLQEFASIKMDDTAAKQVKTNADAFIMFSDAMSKFKGTGQGMWSTLTEGASQFFEIEPPVEQMKKFAAIDLGKEGVARVKDNAQAFVYFSQAMESYKGGGTSETVAGTIATTAANYFGADPPVTKMQQFAQINLGKDGVARVKTNAEAFVAFSNAMAQYKGGGELKNAVDSMVGGVVKFFGGDDVITKFVKFTKLDVDPDRAMKLGQAFNNYMTAMGGGKAGGGAAPASRAAAAPAAGGGGGGGGAGSGGGVNAGAVQASYQERAAATFGKLGSITSKAAAALGFGGGETDPDADADASAGSADKQKMVSSKPKNVTVGPSADISGVDNALLTKFFSAANEYGQPIKVNSAFRGDQKQAELWVRGRVLGEPGIHTPAKPKNDTKITYKGQDFNVPGSGKGSKHREGDALDISVDHSAFDPILAKYGLHRPYPQKDPPHVEIKAEKGGVASGPRTGYPATLHGNEMIVPIDPNSLLVELGKKSKNEIESQMAKQGAATGEISSDAIKELASINQSMMDMMANKLDAVISRLETGNDTQGKLLKYSQA